MTFYNLMIFFQSTVGILIVGSAIVLMAMGCERKSPFIQKFLLTGLGIWGIWFAWLAFHGQHDSVPAVALGALVAFVIIKNGKRIVGLLRGETWNPNRTHPLVPGNFS